MQFQEENVPLEFIRNKYITASILYKTIGIGED